MLLSCAFMVSACQKPEDKITIHTPFKTQYYVGEQLDVTGGILNYTKDGKTTQVAITSNMVTGFSSANAGTFNIVIYYQGLSVLVAYTVNEIPALNIDYNKFYRSELINEGGMGNNYAYAKFIDGLTFGMFFTSTEFTATNPPQFTNSASQFAISSRNFVNGKWVVTVVPGQAIVDVNISVTIISETEINVYYSVGVEVLDINLYAC